MAGRRVNKKTKRKKKRIGTMDLILLLVFICLVIFTVTMIRLFQVYGSVPDTLVTQCLPHWAGSAVSWAG